jgi:hypothetical protein
VTFKDGKGIDIISLPFNSPDYSTEHPLLPMNVPYFLVSMLWHISSFDIFSVAINHKVCFLLGAKKI